MGENSVHKNAGLTNLASKVLIPGVRRIINNTFVLGKNVEEDSQGYFMNMFAPIHLLNDYKKWILISLFMKFYSTFVIIKTYDS